MQKQYISYAPHSNATPKTLLRPEITPILYDLVNLSAIPLSETEDKFAVDSSGFRCSSFGAYCEHRHRTRRRHNWLKVHIIKESNCSN
jgi:hypothetical protein